MKFQVQMLAFQEKGLVREVDVSDQVLREMDFTKESLLDKIFYYGQNDFQPLRCRSVSVGDVIIVHGHLYLVDRTGFKEIDNKEFEDYKSHSQTRFYYEKFIGGNSDLET